MDRIDGNYLYTVGSQIHPITELLHGSPAEDVFYPVLVAAGALGPLLYNSIFRLSLCLKSGEEFRTALVETRELIEKMNEEERRKPLDPMRIYTLRNTSQTFENVLAAELGMSNLYFVSKIRGFDTTDLIWQGWELFPEDLPGKVPEAVADLKNATRCLAFELPTACGFHLHRATESILRRYYDAVTGGKARPKSRNVGDYLKKLDDLGAGDAKVKAALRDLKDLHRNPLIHPEESIDTVDEAIGLLGNVRAVLVLMLKVIPTPATPPGTAIVPA